MSMRQRAYLELSADRVEAVLAAHRAPCQITGGTVGPQAIRFFLEPFPHTRFKAVKALADDIGVALGTDRVQIGVGPGGGIVLTYPNPEPGSVAFEVALGGKALPGMTALLGLQLDGTPVLANLASADVAHVLIAGTTGSGKSTLLRSIVVSLILYNRPAAVSLVVMDPKGRTLPADFSTRHFIQPVITTPEDTALALGALVALMEERDRDRVCAPPVILVVDELADLVMTVGSSQLLTRLVQRGREAGIHVIAATQRPSAAILSGLMRANFPLRIVGRVVSPEDSRIAAGRGQIGAEKLQGHGDFVAVAESPIRFQAAWISADGLRELTANVPQGGAAGVRLPQPTPVAKRLPTPTPEAERLPTPSPLAVPAAIVPLNAAAGGGDTVESLAARLRPFWQTHGRKYGAKTAALRYLFGEDAPAGGYYWDMTQEAINLISTST